MQLTHHFSVYLEATLDFIEATLAKLHHAKHQRLHRSTRARTARLARTAMAR
jgi:hypothetical protein